MATPQEIAELRNKVKQPENTEPYTDQFLSALIDKYGMRGAAKEVWEAKAASVAHLVNISEGGSSRSMSDVHKNYLKMAETFAGDDSDIDAPKTYAPRSRKAVRV